MSAIAALLNPPKVRHVASRLVIDGKTVERNADLPQLPDSNLRADMKARIRALKKKQWAEANHEKHYGAIRQWQLEHAEYMKQYQREWFQKKKLDPEYREKHREANRKYYERKKHEKQIRDSNGKPESVGSADQGRKIPRARTAAPRLSAIETGNATVSATDL